MIDWLSTKPYNKNHFKDTTKGLKQKKIKELIDLIRTKHLEEVQDASMLEETA